MPIQSGDLTSWEADYRTYRGIAGSTPDAQIEAKLQDAVAFAEICCGKAFGLTTVTPYTEYLNGTGGPAVVVGQTPIVAVTSVSIIEADRSTTLVDPATYRTSLSTGEIRRITADPGLLSIAPGTFDSVVPQTGIWQNFPKGFQNIKVIYTYGSVSYATVPRAFKVAVFRVVDRLRGEVGVRDASDDGLSALDDLAYFRAVYAPFRRYDLA